MPKLLSWRTAKRSSTGPRMGTMQLRKASSVAGNAGVTSLPMKTIKKCSIFALLIAASGTAQEQGARTPSPAASANSLPGVRRAAPPRPTGPTPHMADGTVDLSGVWNGGGPTGNIAQGLPKGEKLPLLPSAEKILKSRQSKDDPETNCLPAGVPRQA